MGFQIEDGKGTGYTVAVDKDNKLHTHSTITDEASFHSQDEGELFSWTTNHDAGAGEYVLCIKNNHQTKHLCIETIRASSDVATNWSVGFGTWSTVGGGAEITGSNAKHDSGNVAQATTHITATNFTEDSVPLLQSIGGANAERTFRPEGKIVLGYNDVLYIKTSAASTTYCAAVVWGFFKDLH